MAIYPEMARGLLADCAAYRARVQTLDDLKSKDWAASGELVAIEDKTTDGS